MIREGPSGAFDGFWLLSPCFFILMPLSGLLNAFLFGRIYPKNKKSSQKFASSILPKNSNKPPVRLKKHNMRKCAILDF